MSDGATSNSAHSVSEGRLMSQALGREKRWGGGGWKRGGGVGMGREMGDGGLIDNVTGGW